ncbi:MAG TPA: ABC transporter ATP-binding protein [Actinomycetota bacterium]|nr:ABC transporter ATP-binding protein [Actinomycetota bacterium]
MRLAVRDLAMAFGGNRVLTGVSFTVDGPQVCGLIGPNGAGKTTLVNVLTGTYRPTGGAVFLDGERIDGLPASRIAKRGMARTFQVTRPFLRMTVLDNLRVPAYAKDPHLDPSEFRRRAREALELVTIEHLADEYARALSGGQRKLLELARLVMLDPEILILDEPSAGVHPKLQETIGEFIRVLRGRGKAFIIISHDMETIFEQSERMLVLSGGALIADGDPDDVRRNPAVLHAYLGTDEGAEGGETHPRRA